MELYLPTSTPVVMDDDDGEISRESQATRGYQIQKFQNAWLTASKA